MARAQPGKLTFASSGPGTSNHLAVELFKVVAGVDLLPGPDGELFVIEVNAVPGWRALAAATGLVRSGAASALVTGPVAKSRLARVGFHYPGQTEFVAQAWLAALPQQP